MYYMFLADGFEETEALVTLDMLRRADIEIKTVGIGSNMIKGTHRICVMTDIEDVDFATENCDGIILPGGMPGTENLYLSETVLSALSFCFENNLLVCAICAAPIILGRKGYLSDKNAVCFPGFENELNAREILNVSCVRDSNIVTAKGAGCVFEFSYEIISYILGEDAAKQVIENTQHKGF